jgi:hypothetical protein
LSSYKASRKARAWLGPRDYEVWNCDKFNEYVLQGAYLSGLLEFGLDERGDYDAVLVAFLTVGEVYFWG